MIKNIIFDFGDIFFNLDKSATAREMEKFGYQGPTQELRHLAETYEKGLLSSDVFLLRVQQTFPKATDRELIQAWNAILLDFPEYRLEFLENLVKEKQHRLFLLSNTNAMHIERVIHIMGKQRFRRFKDCFEQFYLSHEIHLRKPDTDIYRFVLQQNNLNGEETYFVDDTLENTETAAQLGIRTWHLKVGSEDIIDLKLKL